MSGHQPNSTVASFGPFEADFQTQEIRKHGVRLRLPGQSFQILKMLLERPGELVTCEKLRESLWPSDTFVDFEHGLNAAVNRLREALGDAADNPFFIETLHRRGYKFIAPVDGPVSEEVRKGAKVGSDSVIELWVQPLPAGSPHRVGNIRALLATWTPDGTHIVYAAWDTIMMVNKDGSEPHQLAKVSGIVFCIRYSPDGRRIRFDLNDPKIDSNSIWEMGANGKGIHPLFPDWKESSFQRCGNWSPDGNYYYFLAGRWNAQAIWVMSERRSLFRRRAKGPS